MFNFGLPEFLLFGLVAIVFIGPERLPVVARWMGKQIARLRRAWTEVQSEMSQDEDLREIQKAGRQLRNEIKSVRDEFTNVGKSIRKDKVPRSKPEPVEEDDDEWEILRREGLFDVGLSPSKKPAVETPTETASKSTDGAASSPPKDSEEGFD